ncbi:MAG: AMP-binding protein [Acidimicrobiales bacterium]|nr:AMP-binding protein [Acidimicrobiales bacterium]
MESEHINAGQELFLDGQETLVGAWKKTLEKNPEKTLFSFNGEKINRATFFDQTSQTASALVNHGLTHGDRVIISGETSLDLVIAHVACLRLGLILVPVNGSYSEAELSFLIKDAAPSAALVDNQEWHELLSSMDPDLFISSTSLKIESGPIPDLDFSKPEDPALIAYTSGTTGKPKGAVHTQRTLLAGALSVATAWEWTESDSLLLCLPLFHIHGMGIGLHGTLLVGGSAVLQEGFDHDSIFSAITENGCSMFFGVPTMYNRLLEDERVTQLSSLRLCVSGSAPLSADLHKQLKERGVDVLERYGTTETMLTISNPFLGERRAGSVGLPLPGVEIKIEQDSGEILVRGESVFREYWSKQEETESCFKNGWFKTGDIAKIGDDGYISINGRIKELIITGGLNVYPQEVDDVLQLHPDIAEVAVSGVESQEWGEEVVAWVVMKEGVDSLDLDEFRKFASKNLASYKLPKRLVFVKELPRNALGKVLRHELKA